MRIMGLAVAAALGAATLIGVAQAEQAAPAAYGRQPAAAAAVPAANYGAAGAQQAQACPAGSWWMPAQKDEWNEWREGHCVQ